MAQEPSTNRAYNFFYEKDFIKAKEAIDLCIADEKLATKAQTWLYKGNIELQLTYQEYGKMHKDISYKTPYMEAPVESYNAFVKALEINKNIEGFDMLSPNDALPSLFPFLLYYGSTLISNQQYELSASVLGKGIRSYEMHTLSAAEAVDLDGQLYFLYAYSLEMLGKKNEANTYYEKALKDGAKEAFVYAKLLEIYKNQNQSDKILEVINQGKKNLPNDPTIYVAEIDYLMFIKDTVKARTLMKNVHQSIFSKPDALINLANIQLQDKNFTEAKSLLAKALAFNESSDIVNYNLGVCNYTLSEKKFNEANQLEISGQKEQATIATKESQEYLLEAKKYFEIYLRLVPDDMSALLALRNIYIRSNDKAQEESISNKIKILENK
jgi:tetratricopeptide (TPR) repeat protein